MILNTALFLLPFLFSTKICEVERVFLHQNFLQKACCEKLQCGCDYFKMSRISGQDDRMSSFDILKIKVDIKKLSF